jgi:NADPH2:quinone reductase
VGQRVAAQLGYGGYASVAVADVRRVQAIPEGVSFADACALGVAYQTAYLSLVDRAQLAAGETLLVQAAAGGVGLATVQLGRALGARVIAGASGSSEAASGPSGDKLDLCRQHGAHEAIDTRAEDWPARVQELTQGRGADVICESVGGSVFEGSLKCIAWGGRLVVVGFSSGEIPTPKLNRVMLKHIALIGIHIHGYHEHRPEVLRKASAALFELHARGAIKPPISARYPLVRAAEALAALKDRSSVGKLVLEP